MKKLFLSIALALTAQAAQAAPGYMYECDMKYVKQGKGWISPKVVLVLPGDGSVKVVDAVTLHFYKEPLLGTIVRENNKRLVVKWTISEAKTDSAESYTNFDYRASISKRNGAMELTAIPRNFEGGLRSPGTCRKRNQ